jgi:hypothetical protein
MSRKLENNGLFESSRMMLPEHKEAYLQHQQRVTLRSQPILDWQEVEQISALISEAISSGMPIECVFVRKGEEQLVRGRLIRIDQQTAKLQLCGDTGRNWIALEEIVRMTYC